MDSSNAIITAACCQNVQILNRSPDEISASAVEISWSYFYWFRREMKLKTAT